MTVTMEHSSDSIDISSLQFVFDNVIKVVQTRAVFLEFLEHRNVHSLLLFYESVTYMLKKLSRYVQETSKVTSPRNLTKSVSYSKHSSWDKGIIRRNSETNSFSNLQFSFSLMNPDDFIFEFDVLVGKYLLENSPLEIKLFLTERNRAVDAFESWKKYVPRDCVSMEHVTALYSAFNEYITLVHEKMQSELFPALLKSDAWFNFWAKTTDKTEKISLLQRVAQKKLPQGGCQKLVYTYEEFVTEPIREKDFLFLFQLIHDSTNIWKPLHEHPVDKHKPSIFKSSFHFLADKSEQQTVFFKIVGHLPHFIDDVVCYLLTGKFVREVEFHDSQFEHIELVEPSIDVLTEDVLSTPSACSINYIHHSFGLSKRRENIIATSLRQLNHLDQYMLISKTCEHQQLPTNAKSGKSNYMSGLSIQRVSSEESRYVYCALMPLTGILAKSSVFVKSQIEHRAKSIHQLLSKHMQELNSSKFGEMNLNDYNKSLALHKVLPWNQSNLKHTQPLYSAVSFENDIFDLRKAEFRKLGVRI